MRTADEFITLLQAAFNSLEETHSAQIRENLYIFLLYDLLINERHKMSVTENSTPDALKEMLHQDEKNRRALYSLPRDDLTFLLKKQNTDALKKLLELIKNPAFLLEQLKTMRETNYKNLIHWEAHIKNLIIIREKSGLPYFKKQSKELGWFVYQYSLVGLSEELASLFFIVLTRKPSVQTVAAYFKQKILQGIYVAFYATTSPEKAKRAHQFIAQCLTEGNTLILFKMVGFLVGIFYTYLAGLMSLFRLLTLNIVALKASQHLSSSIIDDINARVTNYYALPFDPTYTFCFRTLIMASVLAETLHIQSTAPFIQALSSIGGSIALTRLGQRLAPNLCMVPNQKATPEQMFFLLILSNTGYLFGEFVLSTFNNVREKAQMRDNAIERLRKHETLVDLKTTSPSLLTTFSLWLNDKNPLDLSWQSAGSIHRVECEITAPNTLLCNPVVSMSTLDYISLRP